MNYIDKTLDFLHQQGWSYGMVRYLDTATRKEIYQIDAHQGETWKLGRGSNWEEAAKDLIKKISDMTGPILH
jgi:hypothetical protein